jgi:thiosulfate/3-mercaptopyruvate sulfurtransferase
MPSSLATTEWLAAHLHDPDLRVIDVRWYLLNKDKQGREEYLRGHIPGAVFMDIETDLSAPRLHGPGRHPLPPPSAFAESASRAGIGPGTFVVAYDDTGGATAARLWWLLRYFGHERVSLLDGGISRWIAEGRPLKTGEVTVARAEFVPFPHPEWVVDQKTVDRLRRDPTALILDARAAERYEGKTEPVDPKAGHIPGAKSAPFSGNLRSPGDPRLKEPSALKERFGQLGADQAQAIVTYCGSGVNACLNILALQLAGYGNPLLYEGSWSDWSRNPDRPVAVGPNP